MTGQHRDARLEWVAWVAALAIVWITLALTAYRTRDPDSRLHIDIEIDLARLPYARWIAPEWNGHWNSEGLYREHPIGVFILPALLIRAGYPPASAGYAVNAVYQVLTVALVTLLAGLYLDRRHAHALGWLLLLLPVSFTYRIRANHEQALLLCLLMALYGTARSRESVTWALLTAVGLAGAFLVKGLFAVPVALACGVWLALARPSSARRPGRELAAWAGLMMALAAGALVVVGYEHLYRAATGESFLAEYLRRQLGAAAVQESAWVIPQKLYNVGAYLGRVAWFAAPWSFVLAVALFRRRPTHPPVGPPVADRVPARRALLAALVSSGLWILLFSLSDRRTDRYIFTTYFLVGGAGAGLALQRSPALQRWIARIARARGLERPAIWLALFFAHLGSLPLGLPFVNW